MTIAFESFRNFKTLKVNFHLKKKHSYALGFSNISLYCFTSFEWQVYFVCVTSESVSVTSGRRESWEKLKLQIWVEENVFTYIFLSHNRCAGMQSRRLPSCSIYFPIFRPPRRDDNGNPPQLHVLFDVYPKNTAAARKENASSRWSSYSEDVTRWSNNYILAAAGRNDDEGAQFHLSFFLAERLSTRHWQAAGDTNNSNDWMAVPLI